MEHWNQLAYLFLNAAPGESSPWILTARFFAQWLIWGLPAGFALGWLLGSTATRLALVEATLSVLAGLLINQLIGLAWYHPRPFELGIGRTLILHVRDSSFPSDHLTVIWAAAISFALRERTKVLGCVLLVLGFPVAWARIYLGVHFPLDMLGAALVAMGGAGLVRHNARRLIPHLLRVLLPPYRVLFAGMIRIGWARL